MNELALIEHDASGTTGITAVWAAPLTSFTLSTGSSWRSPETED